MRFMSSFLQQVVWPTHFQVVRLIRCHHRRRKPISSSASLFLLGRHSYKKKLVWPKFALVLSFSRKLQHNPLVCSNRLCGWLKRLRAINASSYTTSTCSYSNSNVLIPLSDVQCGKNTNNILSCWKRVELWMVFLLDNASRRAHHWHLFQNSHSLLPPAWPLFLWSIITSVNWEYKCQSSVV